MFSQKLETEFSLPELMRRHPVAWEVYKKTTVSKVPHYLDMTEEEIR